MRINSIRQLGASLTGALIAAAEFHSVVYVWDLRSGELVQTLKTRLDYGGKRLAISADGMHCVAGSYSFGGVVCHSVETREEVWSRTDFDKPQHVSFTPDDKRTIIGLDHRCCVLDRASGSTMDEVRGTHDIVESRWQSAYLASGRQLKLVNNGGQPVIVPRLTFAELDVAFGPDRIAISESTGPLRCLSTETGIEEWRHHEEGRHVLQLCYHPAGGAFLGVDLAYERGRSHRMLRFDAVSGRCVVVCDLDAGEFVFCLEGTRLLGTNGEIRDTETGSVVARVWTT